MDDQDNDRAILRILDRLRVVETRIREIERKIRSLRLKIHPTTPPWDGKGGVEEDKGN